MFQNSVLLFLLALLLELFLKDTISDTNRADYWGYAHQKVTVGQLAALYVRDVWVPSQSLSFLPFTKHHSFLALQFLLCPDR